MKIKNDRGFIKVLLIAAVFASISTPVFCAPQPTFTPTVGPGFLYDTYATDGAVYAVTSTSSAVYIGGAFTNVGKRCGSGAALDSVTGNLLPGFPKVLNMEVTASCPDSSGGWYIGGTFTFVNGEARNGLAHIYSNGSLDPAWVPSPNGLVHALMLFNNLVYAGGEFTQINGATRNHIAAIDANTGALDNNFVPDIEGGYVSCLGVFSNQIYAGGAFTSANSTGRHKLARFDLNGGLDTQWDPDITGYVSSINIPPSGSVFYAGGNFSKVNAGTTNISRNNIAAFNISSGNSGVVTAFDPNIVDGPVNSVRATNTALYAGGGFTKVNGAANVARNFAAAFDPATGSALAWDPKINATVSCLEISGSTIYAAGLFDSVNNGGLRRYFAADFDMTGGAAGAFDPEFNYIVETLCVSGGNVYCGGGFSVCNLQSRGSAAALDTSTGVLLPWDPNIGGYVYALALANNSVYVGGSFAWVHDTMTTRNNGAAFDLAAGTVKPWDPDLNGPINTLEPSGNYIYAGGNFTLIKSLYPRGYAAKFDLGNGNIQAWNPDLNGEVRALIPYNGSVYAGGLFSSANGASPCAHAGAFDATAGVIQPGWNPSPNGNVQGIDAFNGNVYMVGEFTSVNGGPRIGAAGFDTAGAINSWDPGLSSSAYTIYRTGATFFLGGIFTYVNSGAIPATFLACVDSATGLADGSWTPDPSGTVLGITCAGRKIFAGGVYSAVSNFPYRSIAGIECPVSAYTATSTPTITNTLTVTPTITMTLTITQTFTPNMTQTFEAIASATPDTPYPDAGDSYVFPQPAQDTATFVYGLDAPAQVTILIYDFSGRQVKSASFAGNADRRNKAVVDTGSLKAGPYFYLIKAKPISGTEKKYNLSKFYVKR